MSDEEYMRNCFRKVDKDGSGRVSLDELTALVKRQGLKGTDKDIKLIFASADTSGDGKLSEDEFLNAFGTMPGRERKAAAMRRTFMQYDKDLNGTIDRADMEAVYKDMHIQLRESDISRLMQMYDTDGSGTVDYEEFIAAALK